MLNIPPDHPLLTDFRNVRMRMDATIVFPGGTGGNFLTGKLSGSYRNTSRATNDFLAGNAMWLSLDDDVLGFDGTSWKPEVDPSVMYDRAMHQVDLYGRSPRIRLAEGHLYPCITPSVFDFRTEELVSISVSDETAWLPCCLRWFKNLLCDGFSDHPHKVTMLLSEVKSPLTSEQLHFTSYEDAMLSVDREVGAKDIKHTLLSWVYYLDCINNGCDPRDPSSFRSYVSSNVLNLPTGYVSKMRSDYMAFSRECAASVSTTMTDVDYDGLFFDLSLPENSVLSRIPLDDIARYSLDNLKTARRIASMMAKEDAMPFTDNLESLHKRLNRAMP